MRKVNCSPDPAVIYSVVYLLAGKRGGQLYIIHSSTYTGMCTCIFRDAYRGVRIFQSALCLGSAVGRREMGCARFKK